MKSKIFPLIVLAICLSSLSCKNKAGTSSHAKVDLTKAGFILPKVPSDLNNPVERANYEAAHYWDNFNFSDTTLLHNKAFDIEQIFVDYTAMITAADPKDATLSIQNMLAKAEKEKTGAELKRFLEMSEKYFYDADSKERNDELYIPVARYILSSKSKFLNFADTERAKFELRLMMKNRVGHDAKDFVYTLKNGKKGNLYHLSGDYILLLFHNPDCNACQQAVENIKSSSLISGLVQSKKLSVLAVYPDEDLRLWKKLYRNIPDTWINSYDKKMVIRKTELYDLKAMPTLYLLDKDKKVVLKDVDFDRLIAWFNNHLSQNI